MNRRRARRRCGDITATRAVLAVQGPSAGAARDGRRPTRRRSPRFARARRSGEWIVAGTGYTGEDGVEIHVPRRARRRCGTQLLDAGIAPAGLGARDTLRLEAGLPLHGHELGPGHHAAAGRPRLGRALGQGRLPRPGTRSKPSSERGSAPAARRARASRAANPAAKARSCRTTGSDGRRGHERQLLADARSRDRARVPAARHRARRRASRSTCAASRCRRRWSKPPFVTPRDADPRRDARGPVPRSSRWCELGAANVSGAVRARARRVVLDRRRVRRRNRRSAPDAGRARADRRDATTGDGRRVRDLVPRRSRPGSARPGIWLEDLFVRPEHPAHGLGARAAGRAAGPHRSVASSGRCSTGTRPRTISTGRSAPRRRTSGPPGAGRRCRAVARPRDAADRAQMRR